MRKPIILLIAILLIPPIPSSYSQAYLELKDAYWSTPTLAFGATNTFTVEVESTYSGTLSGISATLTVFDVAGSDYSGTFSYAGSLFEGQVLVMDFDIFLPTDASASHYRAQLVIDYSADGTPLTQTMDLYVTVQGSPEVRCRLSANVKPGWPATAYLTVTNEGDGVARRVTVTVTPASPNVQTSSPIEIGTLDPGESRKVPLTLYIGDSADESVTLTATVTWLAQVGNGGQYTCTQALMVTEEPVRGLDVATNTTLLEPGKTNRVYLLVRNEGEDHAYKATLTLQPPLEASIDGSNVIQLDDLDPGQEKCVPVNISVAPTSFGPLQMMAVLEWYDSGSESHSRTITLGFYVKVLPGPYLVAYSDTRVLSPGTEQMVSIVLRNEGEETARSVRIDFVPSKDLAILSASGVQVGDLPPGEAAKMTIVVSAPNMSYGSLALSLQVSYLDQHDHMREQVIPLSFISESPSTPLISVIPIDTELTVDETSELRVSIKNEGGPARNVVIKISPSSPELGAVVGADYALIDFLDKGEEVTKSFTVYLSPNAYGAVQFLVHIKYEDEAGVAHQELNSLGVKAVGKPQIEVAHVSTVPSPVYPGDLNVKLMVLLTNVGNYLAKDLRVNLTTIPGVIEPSSLGTDTFLIPALPPNQAIEVTFLVDINENAKPGRYEVKLVSDYGNFTLPLQIDEKAVFKLLRFSAPNSPRPGDRGVKLSLVMKNEARATAEDVVIEIVTPYLVGTTSLALGEVPPLSNASAILEVDIDEHAPVEIPVDIKITWKQEGRSLHQTIQAKLKLAEKGRGWWESYTWMILVTVVAIGAILVIPELKKIILGGS